jgi:3-phosphoshikimate 1-carboxyvinyltransferase
MTKSNVTQRRNVQASPSAFPNDATVLCGRDKSLTHRAVMFAALARGETIIREPLLGADCLSTMSCFRALGVQIEALDSRSIRVRSEGFSAFKSPTVDLDCGNSGTTARLISGILAAQPGLKVRLTGDASLSSRPMRRVVDPLRRMGAVFDGAEQGNFLPLTIQGQKLRAASHEVDKASAQVKSALLLAGLFCEGETSVRLPAGSRDHTERMLQRMGAKLVTEVQDGWETVRVTGPFAPPPGRYMIPVDPSSAAFFCVLGLLRKGGTLRLPEVLDNPTRTGFLKVLQRMSPALTLTPDNDQRFVEPVMQITLQGGSVLRPTDIEATEVPTLVDEIPVLAVAAAFADGPSTFHGLEELRVKESDRLSKTAELLRLAGAEVSVQGDSLKIGGRLTEVQPFTYDSVGDHRLAMAAAIMARRSKKPCCILDSECVGVSFPDFYEMLDSIV